MGRTDDLERAPIGDVCKGTALTVPYLELRQHGIQIRTVRHQLGNTVARLAGRQLAQPDLCSVERAGHVVNAVELSV
jgi:hypothetical protein